nr:hypothetical protein [Deltaproteobacteria bacterium]
MSPGLPAGCWPPRRCSSSAPPSSPVGCTPTRSTSGSSPPPAGSTATGPSPTSGTRACATCSARASSPRCSPSSSPSTSAAPRSPSARSTSPPASPRCGRSARLHAYLLRYSSAASAELAVALLACSAPFANLAFRPMGESLSAMAAMLALGAYGVSPLRVGWWLGVAFVLRYPSGLLLVAPALALLMRRDRAAMARALLGVSLPLLALGLADRLAWGSAFHSVRAYLQFNLVDDRARIDFGARPAWFYLACLPMFVPAGAWIALRGLDRRRLGLAGAMALVYLAGMSAIAHKEFRFALVAVPLVTAALVGARPSWTTAERRLALALTAAQSAVVLAVLYLSGYCQGDPARAARWAGGRADLRELVMMNASHPGLATIGRRVAVWGDPKEQRSRTAALVAARGLWWCPPGRYLVCDERRGQCLDEVMRREGCAVVARRGRAVVIARSSMTGRPPGDHAPGSHARE